jgi:hypothetical protein
MSSTTIVTTWSDLYTGLINDMRSGSGVTATTELAKRYIDEAHQALYIGHGEKFHWAERRAFIKTNPEYTTGTLSATIGSGTITGSGTAWNTNNSHGVHNMRTNGKIVIDGSATVYTISAVASDTSATITPTYIGETDTGLSYRYFEDEYDLASDFGKPVDLRSFDDASTIRLIGRSDFRRLFPRNWITNTSIRAAIVQDSAPSGDTTPIRRIRFGPPPSNVQIIPYSYVTTQIVVSSTGTAKASFTADTDEPIMPVRYRALISLSAKASWYREIKDDQRALQAFAEFNSRFDAMIGDQDLGAQKLRIRPNTSMYRWRSRNPYRNAGRSYDVNGRFDRFDS